MPMKRIATDGKQALKFTIKALTSQAKETRGAKNKMSKFVKDLHQEAKEIRVLGDLSLADDARALTLDERADAANEKIWALQRHRTHSVSKQARLCHLAYGFLRGTTYKEMEQKTHVPIPVDPERKIRNGKGSKEGRLICWDMIKGYALHHWEGTINEFEERWDAWFTAAVMIGHNVNDEKTSVAA